jgi:hypothetical protein
MAVCGSATVTGEQDFTFKMTAADSAAIAAIVEAAALRIAQLHFTPPLRGTMEERHDHHRTVSAL